MRASPACTPASTRGRRFAEEESAFRSCYQRDRDRIIHCSAFRRLKHKTQVFVEHEGDFYRTRLTHSIEVAQVARTIANALGLNCDLTEAVALAHDLGHTPFGHTGEDALHALMAPYGGFDHNAQTLRIVTRLERHYADFDGLNLTWDTLEGIAKHNGPVAQLGPDGQLIGAVPHALAEYNAGHDLELHTHASAEAQVAALSDDVAYNNHDLHDGLRAGLFTEEEISPLPIVRDAYAEVDRKYPGLDPYRRRHEALRRVFGAMVADLIDTSRARIAGSGAETAQEIRDLGRPVIAFSDSLWADLRQIRAFLFANMYRAPRVMAQRARVTEAVNELFPIYMGDPGLLPERWQGDIAQAGSETVLARLVADYIAGMTDRFALQQHARLTGRDVFEDLWPGDETGG
ncbi:deoxyguanosinetriphosphate triphosphohydrolase [Maliponia aquimaris]|uniref:Deoxyguanosinetriphosphate triphosphohydrolase-like protein n=1 Tax=Maliponia aquimaris TaxID=1673631 RepID=A0A238KRT2_9RHOB|nr:deoxyguanosinetriphosphate triphosphohydrolase [Maliponia aquimaris]SMX45311.1 Deoxyguanosinetriphosphate triphosphohydrolase [Maliponia aquimaris]